MELASSPRPAGRTRAVDLLRRPNVRARDLVKAGEGSVAGASDDVLAAVEVELKYEGYVARERQRAQRVRRSANVRLDNELPYMDFLTLSFEAREKLERVRPETLAQAGRIPGVSPADQQNLLLEVRRWKASRAGGLEEQRAPRGSSL